MLRLIPTIFVSIACVLMACDDGTNQDDPNAPAVLDGEVSGSDLSIIEAQTPTDAGMTDDAAPPTVDELCLEPPMAPAQTPLSLASRCR